MKNILFSTTRQWNPGDEFILMGILRLMRSIFDFNPVIFNRNPEIQRRSRFRVSLSLDLLGPKIKRLKTGSYDNSFKEKLLDEPFIDLAVFAGTPEWASPRLRCMYEYINAHHIPALYLGIGAGDPDFSLSRLGGVYRDVLTRARLIIVRDAYCRQILRPLSPVLLPCPSMLAAPSEHERDIGKAVSIGLIFAVDRAARFNRIDEATFRFQVELYRKIIALYGSRMEIGLICHYIDELPEARSLFGSQECNYSYDARDYLDIYNKFDLVIGPRVHGIGLSASMGIPGIHLQHDIRGASCEGFLGKSVPPGDEGLALRLVEECVESAPALNRKLLRLKRDTFNRYIECLSPVMAGDLPGRQADRQNILERRGHS